MTLKTRLARVSAEIERRQRGSDLGTLLDGVRRMGAAARARLERAIAEAESDGSIITVPEGTDEPHSGMSPRARLEAACAAAAGRESSPAGIAGGTPSGRGPEVGR